MDTVPHTTDTQQQQTGTATYGRHHNPAGRPTHDDRRSGTDCGECRSLRYQPRHAATEQTGSTQ